MKVSCLMLTTNIKSRLHLLEKAVFSVENANDGLLDNKVMSVDIIEDEFDWTYFNMFKEMNWNVVVGKCSGHRGMANNMLRGLQNIDVSDYIYYVEDDIIIDRLPDRDTFEEFAKSNIGFACFNTHISEKFNKDKVNFINDINNYKKIGYDMFLIKQDWLRDPCFLNFPSAFIKDNLFRELLKDAMANSAGKGMEPGLTDSWFRLGYNKMYDVATYLRPDVLDHMPFSLESFHNMANMQFWNNNIDLRHPSINNRSNTIF